MRSGERKEKSSTKFKLGEANKSRQEMKHKKKTKNFQRDPSAEYVHVYVCVCVYQCICVYVCEYQPTHTHTHTQSQSSRIDRSGFSGALHDLRAMPIGIHFLSLFTLHPSLAPHLRCLFLFFLCIAILPLRACVHPPPPVMQRHRKLCLKNVQKSRRGSGKAKAKAGRQRCSSCSVRVARKRGGGGG